MPKNIIVNKNETIYLALVFFTFIGYLFSFHFYYHIFMATLLTAYTLLTNSSLKLKYSSYQVWGVLVIFYSLLSILWGLKFVFSAYAIIMFFCLFVFTYTLQQYCRTIENLVKILNIYIFITLMLLAFVVSYFGLDILGTARMSDTENGVNGNGIAISFLLSIYSIIFILKFTKTYLIKRIFYFTISIIFFVFILFTGSRTALVMLVLPIILYLFFNSKYKIPSLISSFGLLVILYFVVMKVPQFYNVIGARVDEAIAILSGDMKGDYSRFLLFSYGIEWFKENPLFGVGINNYKVLSNVTPPFVGKNFYAHSNIIEILVDLGVLGFLLYYSVLIISILNLRKRIKNNMSKLVLALICSIFIHDIFSMSYYEWEIHFLMCLTFVLSSLIPPKNIKNEKSRCS